MVNTATMWQEDIKAKRKQKPNYTANLPVSIELKYMNANGSVCYETYLFTRYQPYGEPIIEKLLETIEKKTKIPLLQDHHDFEDLE